MVKNLPAIQETWVWFLGWEDPLEKEMDISFQYSCIPDISSILAWRIPWIEEPGGLHEELDTNEQLTLSIFNKSLAKKNK